MLARPLVAFCLALLIGVNAYSYTLILRDGRQVEIPDKFVVSTNTLTYEYAPGINVTLLLDTVDVTATEKFNREASGSLLARASQSDFQTKQTQTSDSNTRTQRSGSSSTTATAKRRTMTDSDLAKYRARRESSVKAYNQRRAELRLPDPNSAEAREQRRREEAFLQQAARAQAINEAEAESYWRARASALRNDIATVNAQINYYRARLAELPAQNQIFYPTLVAPRVDIGAVSTDAIGANFSGVPFIYNGTSSGIYLRTPAPFGIYSNQTFSQSGLQLNARINFGGGGTRGAIYAQTGGGNVNPMNYQRRIILPAHFYPYPIAYATYIYPDLNRQQIVSQLQSLEATRAGLLARWGILEDEARRAGALPGWLRD